MDTAPVLNRDAILGASDLPMKPVDVPQWGGRVFVRTMNGTEREAFEAEHFASPDRHVRARLVAYTCCDEAGQLLFSPDDIPRLAEKSGAALDAVFGASLGLNKISKRDIKELEGN